MNEKNILLKSIKDLLTPKMLKYSLLPLLLSLVVMYIVFFTVAGMTVEHLGTLNVESSQTTVEGGVPHTESFSAALEGSSVIKFLMSYTATSWLATFLIYAIGGFLTVYLSVFVAVIIIGFLTPLVLRELQRRHYEDIEMRGYGNVANSLLAPIKSVFVMIILFIVFIPFYFIPVLNIVAFNLPLYYFFHKMLTFDVSSNICTRQENKAINFYNANALRLKTALLYILSLVPFAVFFSAVFFVIYLGHTYFLYVRAIRDEA